MQVLNVHIIILKFGTLLQTIYVVYCIVFKSLFPVLLVHFFV